MKAWVFSIGETTVPICINQLEQMGFETVLLEDARTSLWEKMKQFYTEALETDDEEFMRVDGDIVPNENVTQLAELNDGCLWHCATGWDWYRQDIRPISIHHMKRAAVEICLDNIESAKNELRPETYLWRLSDFHHPRVCHNVDLPCGLHGYGQTNQRTRVRDMKDARGQGYDWRLIERLEAL